MNPARNSGSTRTALLCLIAAVGGAALATGYFQLKQAAFRGQLAAVSEAKRQSEANATDPKEVEKLRAQVREAVELKKEAEEVHRLRGEVTLLRKDKAAFEQAKAENAQLRVAALQARQLQSENSALRGQVQSAVQNLQHVQALAVGQPGLEQKHACIANLKQIDGAVQQWALETRKQANSPVEWRGVLPYLKGSMLPLCPLQGTYGYAPGSAFVAALPQCSVPGHTL